MSTLTSIILCPLIAALVLCFVPRNYRFVMRIVAVVATFVTMFLAIKMFWQYGSAVAGKSGYKFEQIIPWVKSLGLSYHVGVDGINVGLILMGAIVAFAAACVSWDINNRDKEFYILLLVMAGGILGAFASLDMFMFYFFHELALVPTFIMIGVWGRGENKNYATFQITLYLSVGALISLVGLIALYIKAGANSFDIVTLTDYLGEHPLSLSDQRFIFPLLLFGFGILISLWPFHTWAPLGYGSAPTATAMLHAGVLKKFGLYGLIRIALPLMPAVFRKDFHLPWGSHVAFGWLDVIAWLCLGNIFYCGLVAMRQKNFNWLIGYSSVAHMGFVFLGIASLNLIGITGAVLVMIAHGFLAALSFALSGYLYSITNTLEMEKLGGLLRKLPFIGAALMMALFAGCGLPGFANFAGEVTIFFGSFKTYPVITGIAVWGASVIGAVYMLRAIRNILHGPVPEKFAGVAESAFPHRKIPYLILLASLLVFGFFPKLLTEKIEPSAKIIVAKAGGGVEPAKVAQAEPASIETKKH